MKSITRSVIAIAISLVAMSAQAQNWTTVSASNITDLNQNKLAAGQLCFLGTDQNDNPISFGVGGGGQVLKRAFCSPVAAGAVAAFTVPNPANTLPAGVYYRVTVKDTSTGLEVLRYTLVTFTGSTFSFDNYAPIGIGGLAPLAGNAVNGNLSVSGNASIAGALTAGSFNPTVVTSGQFTSNTANPAGLGILRLASGDAIDWRNNANSANIALQKTGAATGLIPADALDASAFGAVLTKNMNGDLWVGPGTGQYASMSACYSAASVGQTCHVTAGWSETFSSSLTMNKNAVGFQFHGSAVITMGANPIVIPDGNTGAFIECPYALSGIPSFGSASGCTFKYTGSGTAIAIGTPAGTSQAGKVRFKNFILDLTGAGTGAIGIDTYGLNQVDWSGLSVAGTGATSTTANTQICFRMNTNAAGDGEGGLVSNSNATGCNIDLQLNSVTYKTFVEMNLIAGPGFSGSRAFDCQSCAAIRFIGGGSNVAYTTGFNFAGTAGANYVASGAESSTNAAVFAGSTANNTVIATNVGNYHDPSDSGTENVFIQSGNTVRATRGQGGSNSGWVVSAPTFADFGLVASGGGTNNKNWDIVAQSNRLDIRSVSDDNSTASPGLTFNRSGAGANGYVLTSVQVDFPFILSSSAFANLGTPGNGTLLYCSDCTVANPCAGSGSGALAKRINGVWVCN